MYAPLCRPRWLSRIRVRLVIRRSRARFPPATFFRRNWLWNIFYYDSRRTVVSFCLEVIKWTCSNFGRSVVMRWGVRMFTYKCSNARTNSVDPDQMHRPRRLIKVRTICHPLLKKDLLLKGKYLLPWDYDVRLKGKKLLPLGANSFL